MLRMSIMKFFVIYLSLTVGGAIAKAQSGVGGPPGMGPSFGAPGGGGPPDMGPSDGEPGGGPNLDGNVVIPGCPPMHGEVNGGVDLNTNGQGGGVSGGVKANVSAQAWKKYCKCMRKQLSLSGSANVGISATGVSASGNSSIMGPTKKCKDPYETITEESGYSYTISPERGETRCLANTGIELRYITEKRNDQSHKKSQDITYNQKVDAEHPLYIDGTVSHEDVPVYEIPRSAPISTCDKYDEGTWEDVVITIWNLGLTQNGTCPQAKGTFNIQQQLSSTTIKFPEKVPCGNYTIATDADNAARKWAFRIKWYFTIEDDGTCISEKSQSSSESSQSSNGSSQSSNESSQSSNESSQSSNESSQSSNESSQSSNESSQSSNQSQ